MTEPAATWLTQEAFDRLTAEYEHLAGPGRLEIAKKIEEARSEGDLKENGGYHAAKEEQGKREARIRQLRHLLDNAQVGEAPASADGKVAVGMVVTIDMSGKQRTFLLGNREIAGDNDIEVFSEGSPLGAAILGQSVGDSCAYTAPNGKEFTLTIKEATPFSG